MRKELNILVERYGKQLVQRSLSEQITMFRDNMFQLMEQTNNYLQANLKHISHREASELGIKIQEFAEIINGLNKLEKRDISKNQIDIIKVLVMKQYNQSQQVYFNMASSMNEEENENYMNHFLLPYLLLNWFLERQ